MHIGLFNLYIVQLNKFIDYMVGGRTIKIDSSKFYACDFFFFYISFVRSIVHTHDTIYIGQIDSEWKYKYFIGTNTIIIIGKGPVYTLSTRRIDMLNFVTIKIIFLRDFRVDHGGMNDVTKHTKTCSHPSSQHQFPEINTCCYQLLSEIKIGSNEGNYKFSFLKFLSINLFTFYIYFFELNYLIYNIYKIS